jgi:hypothetical protein
VLKNPPIEQRVDRPLVYLTPELLNKIAEDLISTKHTYLMPEVMIRSILSALTSSSPSQNDRIISMVLSSFAMYLNTDFDSGCSIIFDIAKRMLLPNDMVDKLISSHHVEKSDHFLLFTDLEIKMYHRRSEEIYINEFNPLAFDILFSDHVSKLSSWRAQDDIFGRYPDLISWSFCLIHAFSVTVNLNSYGSNSTTPGLHETSKLNELLILVKLYTADILEVVLQIALHDYLSKAIAHWYDDNRMYHKRSIDYVVGCLELLRCLPVEFRLRSLIAVFSPTMLLRVLQLGLSFGLDPNSRKEDDFKLFLRLVMSNFSGLPQGEYYEGARCLINELQSVLQLLEITAPCHPNQSTTFTGNLVDSTLSESIIRSCLTVYKLPVDDKHCDASYSFFESVVKSSDNFVSRNTYKMLPISSVVSSVSFSNVMYEYSMKNNTQPQKKVIAYPALTTIIKALSLGQSTLSIWQFHYMRKRFVGYIVGEVICKHEFSSRGDMLRCLIRWCVQLEAEGSSTDRIVEVARNIISEIFSILDVSYDYEQLEEKFWFVNFLSSLILDDYAYDMKTRIVSFISLCPMRIIAEIQYSNVVVMKLEQKGKGINTSATVGVIVSVAKSLVHVLNFQHKVDNPLDQILTIICSLSNIYLALINSSVSKHIEDELSNFVTMTKQSLAILATMLPAHEVLAQFQYTCSFFGKCNCILAFISMIINEVYGRQTPLSEIREFSRDRNTNQSYTRSTTKKKQRSALMHPNAGVPIMPNSPRKKRKLDILESRTISNPKEIDPTNAQTKTVEGDSEIPFDIPIRHLEGNDITDIGCIPVEDEESNLSAKASDSNFETAMPTYRVRLVDSFEVAAESTGNLSSDTIMGDTESEAWTLQADIQSKFGTAF